jgi:cytochrome b561
MAGRYTAVARWLHWLVAVLVTVQIWLGLAADRREWEDARPLVALHAQLGLLLFGLVVLRLAWRLSHPPPPLPETLAPWRRRAAEAVHRLLYALLLILPLSGYALWSWLGEETPFLGGPAIPYPDLSAASEVWRSVAGYVHEYAFFLLAALVLAHVTAALAHEARGSFRPLRDRMT